MPSSRHSAPAPASATNQDQDQDQLNEQLSDVLDPKSAISKVENVHRAVVNPYYWSLLSAEDRAQILHLWPDQEAVIYAGTTKAVLDFDCIKVNRDLRVNCRQYVEDHQAGRHEPAWLAAAERAHVQRAEGLYDEMRAQHVERQFGVPVPRKESKGKGKADQSPPEVHADKDNRNVSEKQSDSKQVEDKIIVHPETAEQEDTEQQKSAAEQDPIVQQVAAVQEGAAVENATMEPEQTAATSQVADTESDKGKKAEDVSPETSPTTRSGVLRRSKRQTSRSNPISRASSG
ncbi:proline-rich early nodulin-like protein [Apiospora phragmitis]|uniref:Proline-rich early nodulin-like protein n=1 Tax=Apiospora phragmitis TaxID=2905665 RepID=A0ABR1UHH6_9PEZI